MDKLIEETKGKNLEKNSNFMKMSYKDKVLMGKLRKLQHSLAILYINQIDILLTQDNYEKALENLANANHIYQGFAKQAKIQEDSLTKKKEDLDK